MLNNAGVIRKLVLSALLVGGSQLVEPRPAIAAANSATNFFTCNGGFGPLFHWYYLENCGQYWEDPCGELESQCRATCNSTFSMLGWLNVCEPDTAHEGYVLYGECYCD